MSKTMHTNYAAATSINVNDVGMFKGKYFIHRLCKIY
jgi:hypothetical protein